MPKSPVRAARRIVKRHSQVSPEMSRALQNGDEQQ
jgi:hypothetical protein